ncbi:MAG: hypothetical protein ACR2IF_04295 [Terriglobales bacterium]
MAVLGMFAPAVAKPSTTVTVSLWLAAAVMGGLILVRRKNRKTRNR